MAYEQPVLREEKGTPLTYAEGDRNFQVLNAKQYYSDSSPTATDDVTKGFSYGSKYYDEDYNLTWICTDNKEADATWQIFFDPIVKSSNGGPGQRPSYRVFEQYPLGPDFTDPEDMEDYYNIGPGSVDFSDSIDEAPVDVSFYGWSGDGSNTAPTSYTKGFDTDPSNSNSGINNLGNGDGIVSIGGMSYCLVCVQNNDSDNSIPLYYDDQDQGKGKE